LKTASQPAKNTGLAPRRVVLLGASNLTKSIGTVLNAAAGHWNEPLEIMAALGHGRAYTCTTRVLGRQLPAIQACGLWQQLSDGERRPTAALVTDIGNDLIYERPVEEIASCLERCLDRLAAAGARTIVTALPLDSVRRLSPAKFRLFRSLLFPYSRLTLADATQRAIELDERVRALAAERQFAVFEQRSEWYGFDPIHIRFGHRPAAWSQILGGWSDETMMQKVAARAVFRTFSLRLRAPHEGRLWGFARRGVQPIARLSSGSTISIY